MGKVHQFSSCPLWWCYHVLQARRKSTFLYVRQGPSTLFNMFSIWRMAISWFPWRSTGPYTPILVMESGIWRLGPALTRHRLSTGCPSPPSARSRQSKERQSHPVTSSGASPSTLVTCGFPSLSVPCCLSGDIFCGVFRVPVVQLVRNVSQEGIFD